ncbi:MAG: MaoC family dehydratase [Deltaproteobacteria bacterium]
MVAGETLCGTVDEAAIGDTLVSLGIGPISRSHSLEMAQLTREYHPAHVMPRPAGVGGSPGPTLHPLWISSLLDRALAKICERSRVIELSVDHRNTPEEGDSLTLAARLAERNDESGRIRVRFEVMNQRRKELARG